MTSRLSEQTLSIFLMTNSFETGGSERQFVLLVHALRERGFRVSVGCILREGPFLEGLGDVSVFPAGGSLYARRSWKSRFDLARHLRAGRIDVAQAFDLYSNLMLIPAARLAGVPVVLGSHRQLGDCFRPSLLRLQHLAFRVCDGVVCNSQAAAETLVHQGLPRRKIAIIHNGLAPDAFAQAAAALPHLPPTLRVGMIARMNNTVKNYPIFLRAAARLAPRFPNLEFLLVGDGPLRPDLERLAQSLGLGQHAVFLGDRRDIPAILASMDISVLPSRSESLSNAIIESMAAGLPVVATRVGGNGELVRDGETGLLVPVNDEASLADALERLITQPELRSAFARRAKEVATASFSMDGVVEQYQQLFFSLRSRRKGMRRRTSPAETASTSPPKPVRVAMVAPSLRYVGGQSAQAHLMVRKWQNDPEAEITFIPVDPEFPRPLAWAGKIPFLRTMVRFPFYLLGLWRGLKHAEVIHIFSASYWSFLLAPLPALVVAKLRGAKTLVNYRSGEARDHLTRWRTALPILRRVDGLVAPSEYLATVFREFGLTSRVVPNFVDEDQFHYRLRQPLRPRLVCTRGFGVYYSVDLVVRAFTLVKQEFTDASLILAGSGSEEARIRSLVRELGLRDVEFTGPVTREKIGLCYDRADVFINASWLDNMPVSILEAFASGTPVVSTAPEGIRHIVRHEETGLLSEPGDWESLGRNVIRLLKDPELAARLSQNACQESKKYRWEAVRLQWLSVYRSLLDQGKKVAAGGSPDTSSTAPTEEVRHENIR